jgi:hypothetical protein
MTMTKEEMIKALIAETKKLPLAGQSHLIKESAKNFDDTFWILAESKDTESDKYFDAVSRNITAAFVNYITANALFGELIGRLSEDEVKALHDGALCMIHNNLKSVGYPSTAVN